MPGISTLPANLTTLVLETFLYGLLLLLFISAIYLLSTRRTLARQTARYHLSSLVFLAIAALFLVVTTASLRCQFDFANDLPSKHWSIVVYQAFFTWIHLGNPVSQDAFYADLAQPSEIAKIVLTVIAVLLGDAIVTYRLWIVWDRNIRVVMFPIFAHIGLTVSCVALIIEVATPKSNLRGTDFVNESKPWQATGAVLSLLANVYSTGFIAFRIWRVTKMVSSSESTLKVSIFCLFGSG
ncbi:hypothetical protein MSAN_01125900 [Mycena sanguinolenta]|uniref:Uncharacterized protein n=1 Tax=Mycena sanguinolenta TaxID=230812 RepID=A0A8H7D6T4_9AGAR|nr:hypothetical protein MSAN_01125900 [Mycena sanguinolenta]